MVVGADMTTRVKICGITRCEDAQAAAAAGADAIGLVFFSGSPRCVTARQAADIVRDLPAFVSVVGLFVNASAAEVEAVLAQVPLDLLQFHGDETAVFCRRFQRPYVKAIRVQAAADIQAACAAYPDARALLFDAYHEAAYGGTGQVFDWQMLPETLSRPWILAGGLNPANIGQAVRQTRAPAVDVSGGVEQHKGIKDAVKIKQFIQGVRDAGL